LKHRRQLQDHQSIASEDDWMLWQLADSAFPAGGFAHSGGLEAAWQHGQARNASELAGLLESSLRQLGHASLPFVGAAHDNPSQLAVWPIAPAGSKAGRFFPRRKRFSPDATSSVRHADISRQFLEWSLAPSVLNGAAPGACFSSNTCAASLLPRFGWALSGLWKGRHCNIASVSRPAKFWRNAALCPSPSPPKPRP
jgi:hypothetical protein